MPDDILLGVKVQGDQALGFFKSLAAGAQQTAQSVSGIGPAFAGVAQGIQSLRQLEQARKAATTAAIQEGQALAQQVAIQRQVLAGTLSLEQGTRKLAEAQILAKTGSQELSKNLAALRIEAEKNQKALQGLESTGSKAFSFFQAGAGALGITVGIGAAVTAAAALTKEGIRYNATLEQQRIGLAALVSATQKVTDAQGRTLEGAEKFAAAQRISSELMRQIQKDALETTATTEQLVDAFQQAVGPLTAAGLSLQESREATLRIVQAASALGIPMHQVAQEVRAIAEGSIDVNARLAKALGITNEQVKQMQAQGQLFEFIIAKTKDFAQAGEATQRSFFGLASSIADISSQLLGAAFQRPFEGLKDGMQGLLNILLQVKREMDVAFAPTSATALETKIKSLSQTLVDLEQRLAATRNLQRNGGVIETLTFSAREGDIERIKQNMASVREELQRTQDELDRIAPKIRDNFVTPLTNREIRQSIIEIRSEFVTIGQTGGSAFDAVSRGIAGYTTETANAGDATEKFRKELDALSVSAKTAANNLQLTQAGITGNVEKFRESTHANIFAQFQKDIAEAQKLGQAAGEAIASAADKMAAGLQEAELKSTEFFIQQEKRKTDAAIEGAEARVAQQQAITDAQLKAASSEVDRLQAVSEAEQRAGASLAQQETTLKALNEAKQSYGQVAVRVGQVELELSQQLLVLRAKELASLQAQAAALRGKDDGTSQARLRLLTDAIEELTNKMKQQEAEIIRASAGIAGAEAELGTVEIERGEAQVALTQKYLEEEEKRTQFTQQQAQARAQIELQSIQQRISAIEGQQRLEAATIVLRREQGASLEELARRERTLIDLEERAAQEAVNAAQVKLDLLQEQLRTQHELITVLQERLRIEAEAGDFGSARETAGHLQNAAQAAVDLAGKVNEAQNSLNNLKGTAVAVGIEGKAGIQNLTNELEQMRSVFNESDFRGLFRDLLGADSLKDAGRILERETKKISDRVFEALIFGKKDKFDAPLIKNVNDLFRVGDGGLLGGIMQAGAKDQAGIFGDTFNKGAQQTLSTQLPQTVNQALSGTESIFQQQGTALGGTFGENCLTGFENVFGKGIGGVINEVLKFVSRAFGSSNGAGLFDNVLSGGSSTAAGTQSGTQFGGGFLSGLTGFFGGGGNGIFDNVTSGSSSTAAGAQAGTQFGSGFMSSFSKLFSGQGGGIGGYLGLAQAFSGVGQSFSQGKYGAGAGGVVGGALGAYFSGGNAQITAMAAQLGAAIGSIFDKIFNQQGRIDKEKEKIIKYFERVFDIDFKKLTEKQVAKGLAEFSEESPAAKALGAIFAGGLKKGDVQGTTIRWAGQLLGNLRRMGDGAEEVREKLLELADAANFDLKDSIQQINAFTRASGADALTLGNFKEELKEAKKNLKEYADTSNMTAKELTNLAAEHGNTGSQIVTYTDLITGAIQIGTRFNEMIDAQGIAQELAAQSFLAAAEAAGSTGQAVTDLADKIRTGQLSLEEATIALNEMREAAGLAKLSLEDVTIDPAKIEQIVTVLNAATEGLVNFQAGLSDLLLDGLFAGLDKEEAGAKFDEFFNATLRVAIAKAVVGALIDSLVVTALAPFFEQLGQMFSDLVTGKLTPEQFREAVAAWKTEMGPALANVKEGFLEVHGLVGDIFTTLDIWPETIDESGQSLDEIQARLREIDDELFEIARRRIRVDIDLASNLERIGAITPQAKLKIEAEGLQQEFDLLMDRIEALGSTAELTAEQVDEAINLLHEMNANIIATFQAQKAEIEAALKTEIDAIRARGKAQEDAIRASFAAQRAAIEARIRGLEKERDLIQKAFDERREALEKELELAREFQRVGQSIQQTINGLVTSNVAPLSPFAQLSFLQRQAAQIRAQIQTARPEDVPELMDRLQQLLAQIVQLDTPNNRATPEFQRLFNAVIKELEALRDQALARGAETKSLEDELRQLEIDQKAALESIDAQIESARAQLDALSAAEQAALDAAATGIEAEIQAAQDRADAKIDELRQAAADKLRENAELEKELLGRQEQILLTERDVLLAQLDELRRIADNTRRISEADFYRIPPDETEGRRWPNETDFYGIPPNETNGRRRQTSQAELSALQSIPPFLRESAQFAIGTPTLKESPDLARPERVQAPARADRSESAAPVEGKLIIELKATVDITGAEPGSDAAVKTKKAMEEVIETGMKKFAQGNFFDQLVRGKVKSEIRIEKH